MFFYVSGFYDSMHIALQKNETMKSMISPRLKGRDCILNLRHFKRCILIGHAGSGSLSGKIILAMLPAFIMISCTDELMGKGEEASVLKVEKYSSTGQKTYGSLDILFFNNDRICRLDSYQHIEKYDGMPLRAASGAGAKTVFAICGSCHDRYYWSKVNSLYGLEKCTLRLEDEKKDTPVTSCLIDIEAGKAADLKMRRFTSEVIVKSLCFDFSDRVYSDLSVRNVCIYLTNVNAEIPVTGSDMALRLVNNGRADMKDIENFLEKDMIYKETGLEIGRNPVNPETRFLCYPSIYEEESAGTPYTRLVIEGEIKGKTYYWPLNINRDRGGRGIERNKRYIYDIRLTRLGMDSPDMAIELYDNEVKMEVMEWEEKEEYSVRF